VKRLPILILSALLALGVLTLSPGCAGRQQTVESAAYNSIRASDAAVEGALRAWSVSYVDREAKNDATRATDPGGYLARRADLLREHGRVHDIHGRYSDAVRAAVETWVALKQSGKPAPLEPIATPDITALRAQIEEIAK
jgi:hypothetical protein